jgi:predicted DNA-binding transcriptional regulator YafY
MSDDTALTRRFNVIRLLEARRLGASVAEIAREMGVSQKTIRRDLEFLQRINIPIEEVTGPRGRKTWRMIGKANSAPLTFTYDEAVAIYLGRRFLQPLTGTNLGEAAESALRKIRCTLGEKALEFFARLQNAFHIPTTGAGDYTAKAEIINVLQQAMEDHSVVRLTYQSQQAAKPSARDLYPYHIVQHKGTLYLFAFDPRHGEVRHYKVDRISDVEVTDGSFDVPASFNIQEHLSGAFGIYSGRDDVTVVVKFLPPAARAVNDKPWHASQVTTTDPDGAVVARYRLSSTVEIKSWVLSFGASAIVLEPESLRTEIARDLARLLEVHYTPRTQRPKDSMA